MPAFTKNDSDRLDWSLLNDCSVTKYFCEQQLLEDVQWLVEQKYEIIDIDCSMYNASSDLLKAIGQKLKFPNSFNGNSIDAFDDLLYDIIIPQENGKVIVFYRYNLVTMSEPLIAWQIVDALDRHSRLNLIYGLRLITLIQSDDPVLTLESVGSQTIQWNLKEWFNYQRGIGECSFPNLDDLFQTEY